MAAECGGLILQLHPGGKLISALNRETAKWIGLPWGARKRAGCRCGAAGRSRLGMRSTLTVNSRRLFAPKGLPGIARRFNAGSANRKSRSVPKGRLKARSILSRPFGTRVPFLASPALKRRAIIRCPSGTKPPRRMPDAVNRAQLGPSRFVLRDRLISGIVRPCLPTTISRDL